MPRPALSLSQLGLTRCALRAHLRHAQTLRRCAQILGVDQKSLRRLLECLSLPIPHPGHPRALSQVPSKELFARSPRALAAKYSCTPKTVYAERRRRASGAPPAGTPAAALPEGSLAPSGGGGAAGGADAGASPEAMPPPQSNFVALGH